MQDESLQSRQSLDNSCSCIKDFVYIGQLPIQVVKQGGIQGRLFATIKEDYSQVAKVQVKAYRRRNELIYRLLDFTGVLRVHLGFYRSLSSLRVFLGVVFALPTAAGDAIPLPMRWPYLLYCLDDRAHRQHTILSPHNINKVAYIFYLIDKKALLTLIAINKLFLYNR